MTLAWKRLSTGSRCCAISDAPATLTRLLRTSETRSRRARSLVHDAANPAEVASDVIALASVARPDQDPEQVARAVMATVHEWAVANFGAGCEVAGLHLRAVERAGRSPGSGRPGAGVMPGPSGPAWVTISG